MDTLRRIFAYAGGKAYMLSLHACAYWVSLTWFIILEAYHKTVVALQLAYEQVDVIR